MESPKENYAVLIGIVQRGVADSLASTILEMGLCVPLISYGSGMGLRDQLGLLRITLPIEREIIYFIVPKIDAELVEGVIAHKARLDQPGQGILYRTYVRAVAVNLRARRSKRQYAASMDQVIAALDEMRGSSEWRRLEAKRSSAEDEKTEEKDMLTFSLVNEEGMLDGFIRAALEAGAGGATLIPMELRNYEKRDTHTSHAREICDLVIPATLYDAVYAAVVGQAGFFTAEQQAASGMLDIASAYKAITAVR